MTDATPVAQEKKVEPFPVPPKVEKTEPFKTFINKDRVKKLPEKALMRPNYQSTVPWTIILPEGYTVEDCLKPSFWAHVASIFDGHKDFHNFIEVVNVERTVYAKLYVRAIQEQQMVVENVTFPPGYKGDHQYFVFGPTKVAEDGKLKPKWNVAKRGFDVVASDGSLVHDGKDFPTKEQAIEWIDNHMKLVAA